VSLSRKFAWRSYFCFKISFWLCTFVKQLSEITEKKSKILNLSYFWCEPIFQKHWGYVQKNLKRSILIALKLSKFERTQHFTIEKRYFLNFGLFQIIFPDKFVKWDPFLVPKNTKTSSRSRVIPCLSPWVENFKIDIFRVFYI
jgi:hypothetical protein